MMIYDNKAPGPLKKSHLTLGPFFTLGPGQNYDNLAHKSCSKIHLSCHKIPQGLVFFRGATKPRFMALGPF